MLMVITLKVWTCKSLHAVFYVFNGRATTLLSKGTSKLLGVLKAGPVVGSVASGGVPGPVDSEVHPWIDLLPECFDGGGLLGGFQLSLHIDPSVQPVAQPVRRILFGLRKLVKVKLDQLLRDDIIESVVGPTWWLSPIKG